MNRRIFVVTGGLGHLGNMLVRELAQRGEEVIALILPGDPSPALEGVSCVRCEANICDSTALNEALGPLLARYAHRPIVVIHTAGIVSIATRKSRQLWDVNVGGTANMLAFCRERAVNRFVYVSSVHAIPELPHGETIGEVGEFMPEQVFGEYARTKAAATALVLQASREGLDAVVVHPSGIMGPGDFGRGHFTQLVVDYLRGRLTAYVRGGYDFVDVRDVVTGILAAAARGQSGACYILSNRYVSLEELFSLLHGISGRRAIRTVLPAWFARSTASLAELYYRILRQPPLYTSYSLYTVTSNARFSHARATAELAYAPRTIAETLVDTIVWLRGQGRV